jgi:hypothetical protein
MLLPLSLRLRPLFDEISPVRPVATPGAEIWVGGRAKTRPPAAQDHINRQANWGLAHLASNVGNCGKEYGIQNSNVARSFP